MAKQVWTPLHKPPGPDSIHLFSDDALLVLRALRERHRKRVDIQQRRFRQATDGRSYYNQIYKQSFKTEDSEKDAHNQTIVTRLQTPTCPTSAPRNAKESLQCIIKKEVDMDDILSGNATNPDHANSLYQEHISQRSEVPQLPSESFTAGRRTGIHHTYHTSHQPGFMPKTQNSDPNHSYTSASRSECESMQSDKHGHVYSCRSVTHHLKDVHVSLPHASSNSSAASLDFAATNSSNACNDPRETVACEDVESGPCSRSICERGEGGTNIPVYKESTTYRFEPDIEKHRISKQSVPQCSRSKSTSSVKPSSVDVKWAKTLESKENGDWKHSPITPSKGTSSSDGSRNEAAEAVKRKLIPAFNKKSSGHSSRPKRRTEATSQLTLEQVMGKEKGKELGSSSIPRPCPWLEITSLSPSELVSWQEEAAQAEEVLLMLVYADGSSQLRELQDLKNKKRTTPLAIVDSEASYLMVAVRSSEKTGYAYAAFPLSGQHREADRDCIRDAVVCVLESKARIVCFDAQELTHVLISHYNLNTQAGCYKWMILDPKVACWLLDPDNAPVTFSALRETCLKKPAALSPVKSMQCEAVHSQDLALLGPVMTELESMLHRKGLWDLFMQVEVPLIPILAAMEEQGIKVTEDTLKSYGNILKEEIRKAETSCYKAAGHSFQITSHVQLRQVLFEELRLDEQCADKKLPRTSVQNLKSTSESVLHKLKGVHPLPRLVLNHRQLVKLKSTYIDGTLDYITRGYIHTSWEQTAAASGRLQSANPNIQNIPKQPVHLPLAENDSESAKAGDSSGANTLWMREPFHSHDGWSFIAADFQSIELRLLAHLSKDPMLLKVFRNQQGTDIFVQLTSEWLGIKPEEVKPSNRERTKRIVYSVIYGVGPERLAETLNDTKENAKSFTKSFLNKFKGVNSFTHRCISDCQRNGRVRTILNRQRIITNINSQNFHVRAHAERQAVNFVVQGSAADVCKLAMIETVRALSNRSALRARLLVQIHDELLFEVQDKCLDEVKVLLKHVMESTPRLCEAACKLTVPLPVSLSIGRTWGHLETVK